MSIRTRFAPSPTGSLHIGSARTALYCWLFAKKHQGTFILRIEDTDLERSTPQSVQAILDAMQWLELDYQEGPFYQTQRFDRYQQVVQQLLDSGHAYRCYCSKERLEKLRETQLANKQKPRYDNHCRNAGHLEKTDQPFVVRFCNPLIGSVNVEDQVYGTLHFKNQELDDLIIARSDHSPTYNFTVVVDDMDMQITHVIRGDDHINNTPRQINILEALGATPPIYAHLPMILGSDGKRLSKRHGAVDVMQYKDQGYLPDALLNYLVRLGWSHGDQEIFSRDEMMTHFSFTSVNRSPAAFNPEKLLWLNQHYLKTENPAQIAPHLTWHMEKLQLPLDQGPALTELITAQAERAKTLLEMAEKSTFFYQPLNAYDPTVTQKHLTPELAPIFIALSNLFKITDWDKENIHAVIQQVAQAHQYALGKIAQPLRVAVTGNTVSPPIDVTLMLLGKEKVLQRLEKAIDVCMAGNLASN